MLISGAKTGAQHSTLVYGNVKPGDIDASTGKKIIYIAYQTKDFYVAIDRGINLNWSASDQIRFSDDFGEVISQISLMDALIDRIFIGKRNRLSYKKILGDALARLLDKGDSKSAFKILAEANLRIVGHSRERVRMAYINYAVTSVILVGALIILMVLYKEKVTSSLGGIEIFRIATCTLLGGVGAFITTFARFQNYTGKIISGLPIHRLDGALRVFYGLIAGLIISLAIKGQVFAGFAENQSPWIVYFFAMIAGASEAMVPNLIRQAEKQTQLKQPEAEISDPIINPENPEKGVAEEAINGKVVVGEKSTQTTVEKIIVKEKEKDV